MKSAYELAMERMKAAAGPQRKLSDKQKKRVADIEKKYTARIAETKMSLDVRLAAAPHEERAKMQADVAAELVRLEEKREAEKEAVWNEA